MPTTSIPSSRARIVAAPITVKTDQSVFSVQNVPAGQAGEYVVRLRVDGVYSIPIDRQAATPQFAGNQVLKVS